MAIMVSDGEPLVGYKIHVDVTTTPTPKRAYPKILQVVFDRLTEECKLKFALEAPLVAGNDKGSKC